MRARLGLVAVCLLIAAWVAPTAGAAGSVDSIHAVVSPGFAVHQPAGSGFSFHHIVFRLGASSKRLGKRRWELRLRMTEHGKGVKGAAVVFKLAHGKTVKAGRTNRTGWAQAGSRAKPGHGTARVTYLAKHYAVRLGAVANAIGDPTLTVTSLDTDLFTSLTGMALPGAMITVSGVGFTAGEVVHVYLDSAQTEIATGVAEPASGTAPGKLDPIQVLLPQTIVPAQHTIIGVGQTSGAGGTTPLLVFTPWDGLRGDLLSGSLEQPISQPLSYGARAQTLEHDMSPDRMAGGTLVQVSIMSINGPQYDALSCAASSTWTPFPSALFGSGPTATFTQSCQYAVQPVWAYDSNAGLGQPASGVWCNTHGTAGLTYSTPFDFDGVYLEGASDGKLYALGDVGARNPCISVANFPVLTSAGAAIDASPEVMDNGGQYDVVFAATDGKLYANCFAACPGGNTGTAGQVFSPLRIGDGSAIVDTPLVVGTTIYVGDVDGDFNGVVTSLKSITVGLSGLGTITSSPVLYDNRIYLAGGSTVYCFTLSLAACASSWTNYTTGGAITSTPSIANGVLYITSQDGNIYAINALTGAKVWSTPLPVAAPTGGVPFNSSPAYVDGAVYVGGTDGGLYAFYASNGDLIPGFPKITSGPIYSSPAIGQGAIVFSSMDGSQWELLPAPHGWGDSASSATAASRAHFNSIRN